jgi:hypothetical protein
MSRSSRELSNRVEIGVQAHPNRFRRATWWLALWAGVGTLLWLSWQTVLGEHLLYQAGPVSLPHRLIENDCAMCHTTWAPLKRLISFGDVEDDIRDGGHSIDSTKCETCHRVAEHHANQTPAHKDISCAACHQEHEGEEMLTRPSNRHCTACHVDLKTIHGQDVRASETFDRRVTRFDSRDGHPDFALHRLAKSDAESGEVGDKHLARKVLEHFLRPGEQAARWQDRGRVRFNHAAHLKHEYDASGHLVFGLIGKDRKFTDLSRSCEKCHEPDHERRFMQPISYDRHCQECHPLLFDNDRFPGQSVPHRSPDIVRGFLTEIYTLRALANGGRQAPGGSEREADAGGEAKKNARDELNVPGGLRPPFAEPRRVIPGHRDFQKLNKPQATDVRNAVAQAEELALQHRHRLFGYEAAGGCRYCHQVELDAVMSPADVQTPHTLSNWRIVPPNIPERWLVHSDFHHEPHRLLSCTTCHADIGQSKSTGDVNLPSIEVCRTCHSSDPSARAWLFSSSPLAEGTPPRTDRQQSLQKLLSRANQGARTDCVECHRYHDPAKEKLNGPFLPTRSPGGSATRGDE